MARRKRKKNKIARFAFGSKTKRKKKSAPRNQRYKKLKNVLVVLAIAIAAGLIAAAFLFLEAYVENSIENTPKAVSMELVSVPDWVTDELKQIIVVAAGNKKLKLDENAARTVADNLGTVAWLENIKVRTISETIQIHARYRKPVAMLKANRKIFYLDPNAVALNFLPMPKLPVVRIEKLPSSAVMPDIGTTWPRQDVTEAIAILNLLNKMDEKTAVKKPLLFEIESIDISNFAGRKNAGRPHFILLAKDGTKINWGAAVGQSQRYMEASEKEKLAMLYTFYQQHGTLQNVVRYIELRNPRKTVPQPIDSY